MDVPIASPHSPALPPAADREQALALAAQAELDRNASPQRALEAADEVIEIAKRLGDAALVARALAIRSVCQRNLSDLVAAAQSASEASRIFATLDETASEAGALINYGIALSLIGQMSEALTVFERARHLNRHIDNRVGEADALMDIAVVYNMLGDDERAIALYGELLPIYEDLNDSYHVATTLNNMAFARVGWGRRFAEQNDQKTAEGLFRQAIAECEKALDLARASGHAEFTVICYDTLSTALRELGEYERCFQSLTEQLELARQNGGQRMEAVTLANLGEAQRRTGRLPESILTLEKADAIYSTLKLTEHHANLLLSQVAAYEEAGRLQEALDAHRRYHRLETQIKTAAAAEKMQVLQSRLELEKLESELALSQLREAELGELNAQLHTVDREKSRLVELLERQSYEDALTGLHNRRSLDVRLAADLMRAHRYQGKLSVALGDIDNFKAVNDQFSHAVGDEVLRTIANILRESIRGTDYAARYGGEEFVLVFPETPLDDAAAVCEKIRDRIAQFRWGTIHEYLGQEHKVTISFGVTEANSRFEKHEDLVGYADALLYGAKGAGKNQVRARHPNL